MSDSAISMNSGDSLEDKRVQPSTSRRMRPPDINTHVTMESRLPLRADYDLGKEKEKLGKRESKMGFRSLFGRHRAVTEVEAIRDSQQRHPKRGSVSAIGGPPYAHHMARSEVHLYTTASPSPNRPRTSTLRSPTFGGPISPRMATPKKRGALATWDPPPLFQAWPQAARHAMLPACLQSDNLLRLQTKKESISNINHPDLGDERALFVEMARRKHRRNSSSFKFDWTTKLYILCTSGYLLQYSAEGTHDRLPEKMLQLTKDSAAFASDVIPGRHWVLQVASVFNAEAAVSQDTRSLLGRFAFREKRQAADILMVFENAPDMEAWMTTLRREIEAQGGAKALSETGRPKEDDLEVQANAQPSQRNVFKSTQGPQRISQVLDGHELKWDAEITLEGPDLHLEGTYTEALPYQPFDDNSKTSSLVSQDGRQLDGLRDSSNRFSFTSAGQRTVVTSESSPCNSPLRNSFGSQLSHSDEVTPLAEVPPEIRPRPNAGDILERRQSVQIGTSFLDLPIHDSVSNDLASRLSPPPNFSLPQAAGRRRSVTSGASPDPIRCPAAASRAPRRARKPPPSSLGLSRPLSIVADSPSPGAQSPPQSSTFATAADLSVLGPPDSPSMFTTWAHENERNHAAQPEYDLSAHTPNVRTSFQVSIHTSPRKSASMNSLRPADNSSWTDAPKFSLPRRISVRASSQERSVHGSDIPRSQSSLGSYKNRSQSPPRVRSTVRNRSSMYEQHASETMGQRARSMPRRATSPTPHDHPYVPKMSASHQHFRGHRRTESGGSANGDLNNRRSLSQLASPPPPPPLPDSEMRYMHRALPAIPNKKRSESIPAMSRRFRM